MNEPVKTVFKRVLEVILVLAFVFSAFLGILFTLNTVFPTGQGLFDLIRPGEDDGNRLVGDGTSREFRLVTKAGDEILDQGAGFAATLTKKEHSVKSKRAAQIAWQNASEGMRLYNRDAVQTFDRSRASLSFRGGSTLELEENSLIVLRKLERDIFLRENSTVVVLVGGQLTGTVGRTEEEAFNLEVVAPGAVARVQSRKEEDRPSRFQMAVRKDETSILTVLEGSADLVAGGGTLEVGPNQVVKVRPGQLPVYLSGPPASPVLASPEDGKTFTFRDISPSVLFSWVGPAGVAEYRFVLASDPRFDQIVHEDVINGTRFSHGNLKPGGYYWRVSSLTGDWEDKVSPARHFTIAQDLDPPTLEVHYPENLSVREALELTGTTEPGARIFVGGTPVQVDSQGRFEHRLSLQSGPNVIVVEAVDKVGNVTYFSKILHVEF